MAVRMEHVLLDKGTSAFGPFVTGVALCNMVSSVNNEIYALGAQVRESTDIPSMQNVAQTCLSGKTECTSRY